MNQVFDQSTVLSKSCCNWFESAKVSSGLLVIHVGIRRGCSVCPGGSLTGFKNVFHRFTCYAGQYLPGWSCRLS